jgi:predicted phosphohydrolase
MRIVITSDLHYNIARSRAPTEALAAEICRKGGDCLLLVGDSASTDLGILEEVFGLFESFRGVRLAVAGNHELWAAPGEDSLARYEHGLRQVCEASGVHYLDAEPFRLDGVGFVGSLGWYDFSFRPSRMKIPLRFYQHKVGPGAAERLDGLRRLVEGAADVGPAAREVTTRWMDGVRVRLPMGDGAFTEWIVSRLRAHLERMQAEAERIIVGVHHLPFAEMVPHSVNPNWEFATGFLGSELIGEAILDYPKVSHVFCGHSHRSMSCRKGGLVCRSIGSTYREKQYEVLDL